MQINENQHPVLVARDKRRAQRIASGELKQMPVGPNGFLAYALIRDKHGRPKIDDISKLPKQVWDALSQEDKDHLLSIHKEYIPKYL